MESQIDKSLLKVLNAKASGTVAIFDKGDYFSVYREDATFLANEVFRSDVLLKSVCLSGDDRIPYLTMNNGQYKKVVRELLLLLRYRVELYAAENNEWSIIAKGTVGNIGDFEEILGETAGASTIMAVKLLGGESNHVMLAAWDIAELRLLTTEFNDTPHFSQVEMAIVAMSPRECITFPSENSQQKKALSSLLRRVHVMETSWKEKQASSYEDIANLLHADHKNLGAEMSENLKSVLCSLYDYLNMSSQTGYAGKFRLSDFRTSGYMHIDSAAVHALELFDLNYFQDNSITLYGVLNKCKTSAGQRLLRDWIARPLCDLRLIQERQDVVTALINNYESRMNLRDGLLPRIPDLSQLSRKLLQNKAKLQDCYRLYQCVLVLYRFEKTVRDVFDSETETANAVKELLLEPLCASIAQFEKFIQLIQSTIDSDYYEKNGAFRIKPEIDPQLLQISEDMEKVEAQCEKARRKVHSDLSDVDNIKLEHTTMYGFVYRCVFKEERKIRSSHHVTVLDINKGNGVRFTNAALKTLNENYKELNNVYQSAQEELEQKVIETCSGYATSLQELSSVLAVIDVLASLASVSADSANGYCKPELHPLGSGMLELEKCRHPVLETVLSSQFIPNDVSFDNYRLVILTGANMGGKSTYLRATALSVLMAQIGCYVPCSSAKISIVDGIYTRVGASDQQTRGISTFMAEMIDCVSILETATSNSLVIVDELGRGTSTFDGFGLAYAIANDLLKRVKCFCLFATHFHEMAELGQGEGAKAMQMVVCVEDGKLSLLYEIRPGVAKSSFGIHVAKMVGFSDNVVELAESSLKIMEHDGSNLTVAKLQELNGEELKNLVLSC
ncbi:unnamed protein product [Auanema sp. JU1783]|nr:unnamed protein product [Auanema sp. JU1783]